MTSKQLLLAVALLLVAITAQAQGLSPGDPAQGAYLLPYGIEPAINLRTYYFNSTSPSGKESEAWALGGYAGLRSPWLGDHVQLGIVGYTSQPLYAPADKPGSKLLLPDQDAINTLGEAFVALRFAGQTFAAYRQLIDRPFLDAQYSRMVPNTFEAYTLSGGTDAWSYTGGYVTKIKPRDADSFQWMSDRAGGTGKQEGLAFAGVTYTFDTNGYVKLDDQYAFDVYNNFFVEARVPFQYDANTLFTFAAQYYPQQSVGDAQIGSFSTYGVGLEATVKYGAFAAQVSWTQTGKGYNTQNPYGEHASFNDLMEVPFSTAGQRAWGVGGTVDFATLGAPGLTAAAVYAYGREAVNYATGAPIPDQSEADVRVDYAFAKGSALNGLTATFRYAWLWNDGSPMAPELRAILNYIVPF